MDPRSDTSDTSDTSKAEPPHEILDITIEDRAYRVIEDKLHLLLDKHLTETNNNYSKEMKETKLSLYYLKLMDLSKTFAYGPAFAFIAFLVGTTILALPLMYAAVPIGVFVALLSLCVAAAVVSPIISHIIANEARGIRQKPVDANQVKQEFKEGIMKHHPSLSSINDKRLGKIKKQINKLVKCADNTLKKSRKREQRGQASATSQHQTRAR